MRNVGIEFGTLPLACAPGLAPHCGHDPVSILAGRFAVKRMIPAPRILVFDSGLGGLTVYREVAKARPDAHFLYVADDAGFPYGAMEQGRLIARVTDLMEHLVQAQDPDLVVIACNTASTIVLPSLRAQFAVPFVGTVP